MRTQWGYPTSSRHASDQGKGAGRTGKKDRLQALSVQNVGRKDIGQSLARKMLLDPDPTRLRHLREQVLFLCGAESNSMTSNFLNMITEDVQKQASQVERSRVWRSRTMVKEEVEIIPACAVFFARLELPTECATHCGLIDTGAQSAVCGKQRWSRIIEHISHQGIQPVQLAQPAMQTTQGIGGQVKVQASYNLPIGIARINGLVTVTVIEGDAPFLVPIQLLFSFWKSLDGRSTPFVTLHSQHIAIPFLCFAASGCKLPSTHFALHDNLPVGVYHEESVIDEGVPTAIYAQVEAKKRSDVEEIVVASSQRPTRAAELPEQKLPPEQVIAAWAHVMQKVHFLERCCRQIKRATFVIPAATLKQATDIFLPNQSMGAASSQDIRWRDHGKCVDTYLPRARQNPSTTRSSALTKTAPSKGERIDLQCGGHVWIAIRGGRGYRWTKHTHHAEQRYLVWKTQRSKVSSCTSGLWSVGSCNLGDRSDDNECYTQALCRMVPGATEGRIVKEESSKCSDDANGKSGQTPTELPTPPQKTFRWQNHRDLRANARVGKDKQECSQVPSDPFAWLPLDYQSSQKGSIGIWSEARSAWDRYIYIYTYIRQGLGVTKATRRSHLILPLLHGLVKDAQIAYTAIVISRLKVGESVMSHVDKYNFANAVSSCRGFDSLKETDSGISLKVSDPSGALCACLHGIGFTHMKSEDGNVAEFMTQRCFTPGTEELEQTKWLSPMEEKHIVDQCATLLTLAASANANVEDEVLVDDAEEIVLPDGDMVDADEEDGPPTVDWMPTERESKALDLLHRNLAHPPAHKLAKVLKLGGVRPEVWKWVKHSFRCDDCESQRPPQPKIPARLPAVWTLKQIIGVDVVSSPLRDKVEWRPLG
eukprot:5751040-Amphidinium_carterae.4